MRSNRLCELLGICYPIIQAPMAYISGADLAAAVSNTGALGTIGPNPGPGFRQGDIQDPEEAGELLRREIQRARELTNSPFAVNFTVGRGKQVPFSDRYVDVGIEERVPIAIVTMGAPDVYCKRFKDASITVLHAISSVNHALKAEEAGVDGVIAEGFEGGGHIGRDELTTMALVPQVADAVKIPVIAGGGIVDARGLVAALALGADGVYMGTRFMATKECSAHPNVKQAVLQAKDTSTVVFARKTGISRILKNRYVEEHIELESSGASFEALRAYERSGHPELEGRRRVPAASIDGNIELGSLGMSAAAGLIHEILSVSELINSLVHDSPMVLTRIKANLG